MNRIQWSEVVENFVSVRKMTKTSGLSSLCVPCGVQGMNGSVHESDSKNVSTPCVGVVSRKRVRVSREERESRANENDKRMRLKKEDSEQYEFGGIEGTFGSIKVAYEGNEREEEVEEEVEICLLRV